jgi:acetyltransferase-like isoleucine patch superfamily enzyme
MNPNLVESHPTSAAAPSRPALRRYLATSDRLIPRIVRALYRSPASFSLPAPRIVVKPLLWTFLLVRRLYYFAVRVFVCEPLFKAYCKQYGRGLRTGVYIHWVQGKGDIILGDHVKLDGKCGITFAARFADCPTLRIGDGTRIGHNTRFTIGKAVTIGRSCLLSGEILIFDTSSHPTDPVARAARQPPPDDDVRPVVIGDNVWIGVRCLIFPGVRIGEGSTVSAGSVVRSHVPPYTVVAGNPAKVVLRLPRPIPEGTSTPNALDETPA